jgi:formylglycine-generating enzyme required for sulfatase activity
MSDFLKKFLLEDARRFSPSGRFVALAAFGKHPGWDDHVEDLGLETESLNLAKTTLYVNGIGRQIDSGAWEKLEAGQQLPGFKHVFVWQRSGQILVGRLWSSSDGKGRKRYPMVVCLHFMGVTLSWALKQAFPVLAELEEGCLLTTSAADVRALLSRKRAALREAVQSADGKGEYAYVSAEATHRILNPTGGAKPEGFMRVLYQLQSQFGGFAPGTSNVASVRAQQIRVPSAAETPEQALLFWTRFLLVYVDDSVPLLLTLPLEANWVDATAGEPESHEMFCLRATPKAVPLVSEVPYSIDEDFRAKATAFLNGFERGETSKPDLQPARPSVPTAPAPRKGGWLKWLGVGLIAACAVVAAVFFSQQKSNNNQPVASATPTKPDASPSTAGTQDVRSVTAPADAAVRAQEETTRLNEEKKTSDAVAAATRLKAETEATARERERSVTEAAAKEKERLIAEAAAKEKQRQLAEAAAKEKERLAAEAARVEADKKAAAQKQLAEDQQKAAQLSAQPAPAADSAHAVKTEVAVAAVPDGAIGSALVPAGVAGSGAGLLTNSIGMVLVLLPSGNWVGKYEVTQGQYKRVMNANPSHTNWLNDAQPVQQVSWNDAVEFTRKLSAIEQGVLPQGKVYSLPTEKQWTEFAGGQKIEDMPGGSLSRKNGPLPVGQSGPPNKFGLFDVLGNVWEWCLDDAPGDQKVLKGGAFNGNFYDKTLSPDTKSLSCGFRCILTSAGSH